MKTRYLFPNRFKMIGWILLIPSTVVGLLIALFDYYVFNLEGTVFAMYDGGFLEKSKAFVFIENNVVDEIVAVLAIVGGLLAAFSEEKDEDEYIAKIRLESLLWATYINYGFLLFSVIFIYGAGFYQVMLFNSFSCCASITFFIKLPEPSHEEYDKSGAGHP
ncbi:hypothetical protein K3G39_08660 [Pontibacter sp. HSC-14F20]|uniref:hypothetical protein n=1 Tax=Pontibacter sp. HSC-14F20 TaxID=2864136 RepID=UPI001C73644C|nr:hypothetical protein [Pontibacter sp. HSC-14F20]MBX0333309.1 hypothetical protein [Pontibacter sp. HSC-14F20]